MIDLTINLRGLGVFLHSRTWYSASGVEALMLGVFALKWKALEGATNLARKVTSARTAPLLLGQ